MIAVWIWVGSIESKTNSYGKENSMERWRMPLQEALVVWKQTLAKRYREFLSAENATQR